MYLGLFGSRIRIHFVPSFRNRVIAKFSGKRMATKQTFRAEPHAAQHAKSLDCFVRIHRTGGFEPAASREKHGEIRLVAAQHEQRSSYRYALRFHEAFRSLRKSASSATKDVFSTELFE